MGERNKHIENLRKGNRSSFEYLYTVWSGKLYNFVMKISHGDSYLAEEMVQTVFRYHLIRSASRFLYDASLF